MTCHKAEADCLHESCVPYVVCLTVPIGSDEHFEGTGRECIFEKLAAFFNCFAEHF